VHPALPVSRAQTQQFSKGKVHFMGGNSQETKVLLCAGLRRDWQATSGGHLWQIPALPAKTEAKDEKAAAFFLTDA